MSAHGKNSKHKKPKNRKNKIHLVFDEVKRKEFLTGFHKRKLQRKKEAKEKFENDLKEERKRLKAEAKESYKKLVVSHRPIPELEHLLEEEYEDDDVTVKVIELTTEDMAKQKNFIGANQPKIANESEESDEEPDETDVKKQDYVPGMELKEKQSAKVAKTKSMKSFQSEKDVKKVLKKQATKNVQKSKVFQLKNKLERQKQRKKSLRVKREHEKTMNSKSKRRNKPKKN